jgi:cytochrome c-type biogenesis protein CcmH/NrfG
VSWDKADDSDIEQAQQAVKANSYSPEAHFKLAEAYLDENMYEKAIDSYRRAIELKGRVLPGPAGVPK